MDSTSDQELVRRKAELLQLIQTTQQDNHAADTQMQQQCYQQEIANEELRQQVQGL